MIFGTLVVSLIFYKLYESYYLCVLLFEGIIMWNWYSEKNGRYQSEAHALCYGTIYILCVCCFPLEKVYDVHHLYLANTKLSCIGRLHGTSIFIPAFCDIYFKVTAVAD